ncbi:MAG: ankyrin repeat domain-containing protein [Candidatus Rokubacteria bacterium]|nr:ankyrin repeat domain-containing protein [Candidatus Rokubacteria bacterium]
MAERGFVLTPTYRMVAGRPDVHLHAGRESRKPALVVDDRLAPYLFVRQAAGQWGAPGKMRGMASHRTRLAALPMAAVLLLSTASAEADAARARKALDDRYIPFTPKELVARAGRDEIETVKLFLEAGMAVGAANEAGRTALHGAAGHGDGKLLTLLLAAGAPVNARTREGDTPLCVAVEADYPSNVADLLAARADATIPCARGATTLHVTARRGSRQSIAAALLRAGAPADARDSDGRTPLLLLADRDVVPMLRALVAGGVDVNAAGKDGRTALHVALDGWRRSMPVGSGPQMRLSRFTARERVG